MSTTKRQPLTGLSSRLAVKTSPSEPVAVPVQAENIAKGDGRVQIIVRMTPAERKALKEIALAQDTTAQALAEAAIRDILQRHGKTS